MAKNDKPETAVAKQESKAPEKSSSSTAISPAGEMSRMFDRMRNIERRMLDNFFRRDWMSPLRWEEPLFPEFDELIKQTSPKVDVIERDAEVVVRAEVPGVAKDDLDISLTENTVTLRGKTRHEEKEEKGDFRRMEISRGEFSRTLYLPAGVDGAKASAKFRDGVLELTLPKLKKSERHTVKIQEG